MNSKFIASRAHFNALLLTMEREHGTRDTCIHFFDAMRHALQHTAFRNTKDLRRQYEAFFDLFTTLRPRMAIIQNYLDALLEKLSEVDEKDLHKLSDILIQEIDAGQRDNFERGERAKRNALKLMYSDTNILIHSHSHTVLDTINLAHTTHKKFKVIVAEQESARTLDIVQSLQEHNIPFVVVPEYMLCSLEIDINCMLIGCVTLKHDMHFVVDAGTKAVVSQMNIAKIPVHIMLTTNKFSYWQTKPALQMQKTVKSIAHPNAKFMFDRIKFSHDRLPIDQVDRVITEDGIYTPTELRNVYTYKFEEYKDLHADIARRHGQKGIW